MEKKQNIILREVPDDDYLKYNHNLTLPTKRPDLYDVFWSDYKNNGLEYVLHKYGEESIGGRIRFYGKNVLRHSGLADLMKKVMGRA